MKCRLRQCLQVVDRICTAAVVPTMSTTNTRAESVFANESQGSHNTQVKEPCLRSTEEESNSVSFEQIPNDGLPFQDDDGNTERTTENHANATELVSSMTVIDQHNVAEAPVAYRPNGKWGVPYSQEDEEFTFRLRKEDLYPSFEPISQRLRKRARATKYRIGWPDQPSNYQFGTRPA